MHANFIDPHHHNGTIAEEDSETDLLWKWEKHPICMAKTNSLRKRALRWWYLLFLFNGSTEFCSSKHQLELLFTHKWLPVHSTNYWLKTRGQLCPYKFVRKLARWRVCARRAHNCKWHWNEIKRRHQSCWHHNSYGDSSTLIAWTFQRYPTYVSMATAFKLDRNHWSTFKQKKS